MSKRDRRKKRKLRQRYNGRQTNPKNYQPSKPQILLTGEVFYQKLFQGGQSPTERVESSLEKLLISIRSVDVLHLLANLSTHGLMVSITDTGKQVAHHPDEFSIIQPHVELIQALALQLPVEQQSCEPAHPRKIQEIWDLLIENGNALFAQRLMQGRNAKTQKDRAIFNLQGRLRDHTHMIRNWGFFKRVIRITKKLYSPLDHLYEIHVGIAASKIIDIFEALVIRSERAITDHLNKLRSLNRAKTLEECILNYFDAFPDVGNAPEDVVNYMRNEGISLSEVASLTLNHANLRLPDIFIFCTRELGSAIGVQAENLKRALDTLSYEFGDLKERDPHFFFLDNPIWTKPVIRLGDGDYFCPIPQLFFSFAFRILDGLLKDDERAHKASKNRRAKFLETELEEVFRKSFPDATLVPNFRWQQEKEYETDLLLQIDSYLVLVEAKSGSISPSALRGAPERVKKHIEELILYPAKQSARLASWLLNIKSKREAPPVSGLPVDLRFISKIIRLSVTLEDFAAIQSNVSALMDTGWFKAEQKLAPTMTLADLDVVFDILPDKPQKLHYLIRRSELEEHVRYFGDELDLLGLYLQTSFNIGEDEFKPHHLMIALMSKPIDDYYIAQESGFVFKKPVPKSTKWWTDIRQKIESRNPRHWAEAVVMLLNVSYEDQKKIVAGFKQVVANVKTHGQDPHCRNVVILPPPPWSNSAFAAAAYQESQQIHRHELIRNIKDEVFSYEQATRCLIIGVNIDRADYPYSFFTVIDRRTATGTNNT